MNTDQILSDLRSERDRMDRAIAALESLNSTAVITARRGRPPATKGGTNFEFGANKPSGRGGRRHMSAEGRERIAKAARERWARLRAISGVKALTAQKTAATKKAAPAKSTAKKVAPARRGMSAAARKRMSEMMKKRWAARKQAKGA